MKKRARTPHGITPHPPPRPSFPIPFDSSLPDDVCQELWHIYRSGVSVAQSQQFSAVPPPLISRAPLNALEPENADQALSEALAALRRLASGSESAPSAGIAAACHTVSRWASLRGYPSTHVLFAELAAYLDEGSPSLANLAGRACRLSGEHARAEIWYGRAFGLGVRARNKREAVWALLGYGTLLYSLGRYARARRWFLKAATRAARTNQPGPAAEAEHDLMTVQSEVGSYMQGAWHLRRALAFYPVHHWRLPFLVHDFAYLLVQNRFGTAALPLLRELQTIIPEHQQLLLWSTHARAAAAAGDRAEYADACARVESMAEDQVQYAAAGFRNLADAALLLGDHARATEMARRAISVAQQRDEADIVVSASELLNLAEENASPPDLVEPPPSAVRLAGRLLARLDRWKARGRGRPSGPPRGR